MVQRKGLVSGRSFILFDLWSPTLPGAGQLLRCQLPWWFTLITSERASWNLKLWIKSELNLITTKLCCWQVCFVDVYTFGLTKVKTNTDGQTFHFKWIWPLGWGRGSVFCVIYMTAKFKLLLPPDSHTHTHTQTHTHTHTHTDQIKSVTAAAKYIKIQ